MLDKRHKVYLKLNIMSILFTVVSLISVTLAWFAYSGLVDVKTEVGVKAWYIEFEKNNDVISNDIVISLSDIYPGMEPVSEVITIKNLGDSDAKLKYKINSARILDDVRDYYVASDNVSSEYIEDVLSHNYPFHINISLSKNFLESKGTDATFEVSISWPLDSGDDTLDSTWGSHAFLFEQNEEEHHILDNNYQVESSIKVVINVTAEQFIDDLTSADIDYNLGDTILYDVINNRGCEVEDGNCIRTYVIDTYNLVGDTTVTLIPALSNNYALSTYSNYINTYNNIISGWRANTRYLNAEDILKVISTDVKNSLFKRNNISDSIIGNTSYNTRATIELTKAKQTNGYYTFNNSSFPFLNNATCIWTNSEYNSSKAFAFVNDGNISKLYGEDKTTNCKVIPVIIAPKSNI